MRIDLCVEPTAAKDYGHIAFSIDSQLFSSFHQILIEHGVELWQQNASEGDSLYFLDPDGHRLEAHVGDLESRLQAMRTDPYDGQCVYSE